MMQMQIDRENKSAANSFVKSQDQQEIKSALNSPSIIDAISTTGFVSHSKQLLKGAAALLGLSALGGLAYWLAGYFGLSGNNANAVNNTNDIDDAASNVAATNQVTPVVKLASGNGNASPILVHNQLNISQGEAVILNLDSLSATAADTDLTSLSYHAYNVQHGRFDLIFNQGVELFQFTQMQIANNWIRFVHDNSLVVPGYAITVSDGAATTAPQNATIAFNFAPIVKNNFLVIGQDQEVIITNTMLSATDVDNAVATLLFQTSEVQHGQFVMVSTGAVVKEFYQALILQNQIKFIHDGTIVAPSYKMSVSDGKIAITPAVVAVTFYKAPVLTAYSLTVYQGQTVLVNNATLNAITETHTNALEFVISNLRHGKFSLVSAPNAEVTSFSQQQIVDHTVLFTHDNSQVAPACQISVSDGFARTAPIEMQINFDAAPILGANQLTISQGAKVVVTTSILSATDQDSDVEKLIFQINNIQHGQFTFGSMQSNATFTFTQEEIMANNITFRHDGSLFAPTYSVAVSDSLVSTDFQPALINFLAEKTTSSSNTVRNAIISATVTGSLGIGLWLFKKYVDAKTKKEFAAKNIENLVCLALLTRIKVSGCLDYMGAQLTSDLRKAVDKLLKILLSLGVKINIDKMEHYEQQKLIDEIVRQTEKTLLPERNCCYKLTRFFKNYCSAEIAPQQIEVNAAAIARAVKITLTRVSLSASEIDLFAAKKAEVFTHNPLAAVSEEVAASASRSELVLSMAESSNNNVGLVSSGSTAVSSVSSMSSMNSVQSESSAETETAEQQFQTLSKEGEAILSEALAIEKSQSKSTMII